MKHRPGFQRFDQQPPAGPTGLFRSLTTHLGSSFLRQTNAHTTCNENRAHFHRHTDYASCQRKWSCLYIEIQRTHENTILITFTLATTIRNCAKYIQQLVTCTTNFVSVWSSKIWNIRHRKFWILNAYRVAIVEFVWRIYQSLSAFPILWNLLVRNDFTNSKTAIWILTWTNWNVFVVAKCVLGFRW